MKPKTLFFAMGVVFAVFIQPVIAAESGQKLRVMLDWFVNPDHAPLIVAMEKGFFTARGLDVELLAPADPNDPPKLVAAGKADIGVSYQPQLHIQVDQGLPLIRIGTLIATPLNCVVVLRDSPINAIADLKGRKVGYSVSGFEDALLRALLAKHGVKLEEVTLINVNFSLAPSLLSGQVDAVIGAYRNFELNQMALLNKPGRAFYLEEEGIPPYDELILVANSNSLTEPRLRDFVRAVEEATQYLINHPEDAWQLFIRHHRELDDELNRRAWHDTLPRFALRPAALDHGRYQRFAEFLAQLGVIRSVPPLSKYAVELPD
jgi:putative hydroxymethylpyrimidine transport system substrate-binding protein